MEKLFQNFAKKTSDLAGTSGVFIFSLILVICWLFLGPLMRWSDTWQLIITSISSVVTFLMVFLIQYAQNKDTKALHLKLDELIRSSKARDTYIDIEDEPEESLKEKESEIKEQTKK